MRKRLRVTIYPKRDTSLALAYCSLGKDEFCKMIKQVLISWTNGEEIKLDTIIDRGINFRKTINVYISISGDLYRKLSVYPSGIRGDVVRSILSIAFAQALTGIETGLYSSKQEQQEEPFTFPSFPAFEDEDNDETEEEDVFGALSGLFGGLSVD